MEIKLIDPYGLLGVDSRASLCELKKNYYNLFSSINFVV